MTEKQAPPWLQELLDAAEAKEQQQLIAMNKVKADQALAAISVIEEQMEEVESIAQQEIKLIDEWRQSQSTKLNKKISWLSFNLEQFIRKTNEPTVTLAHGILKLRKSKDKVEVVDEAKFMVIGQKLGLVRSTPAKLEPDLIAIANYIKLNSGKPPSGIMLTPGQQKFSYKTHTKGSQDDNNQRNETEAGSDTGSKSATQVAA